MADSALQLALAAGRLNDTKMTYHSVLHPQQASPLVTFALFAYNQEQFIREAVKGALAQTYEPLEIILSDDCSTDKTFEIIKEIATTYKGPHRLILNRNAVNLGRQGLGAHVNRVFGMATGELFVLAAGDDVSLDYRVAKLVEVWLEAGRPSGSLHSAVEIISSSPDLSGTIIHGKTKLGKQTLTECIRSGATGLLGCSHALTSDVYRAFGPLPEGVFFEDRCLVFRSFLIGSILYSPEILVKYRIHEDNISGSNVFSSKVRWDRWIDGMVMCYKSFYLDYISVNTGDSASHSVVAEIDAAILRAERSRNIANSNPIKKLISIYYYTYYLKLPDRIAFALKRLGFEKSLTYWFLSIIWKMFKRTAKA